MMLVPPGVKVHIALGITDMRKGLDGLAMLVQKVLEQDPFSGHLFAFRGRKANLIKIVFWDGTGLCLFTKRLPQSPPVAAQTDNLIVPSSINEFRTLTQVLSNTGNNVVLAG